jgi:hypothetical protein
VLATYWNFELAISGYRAEQQGEEPSDGEMEAMRGLSELNAHLAELAGFDCVNEFNLFVEGGLK